MSVVRFAFSAHRFRAAIGVVALPKIWCDRPSHLLSAHHGTCSDHPGNLLRRPEAPADPRHQRPQAPHRLPRPAALAVKTRETCCHHRCGDSTTPAETHFARLRMFCHQPSHLPSPPDAPTDAIACSCKSLVHSLLSAVTLLAIRMRTDGSLCLSSHFPRAERRSRRPGEGISRQRSAGSRYLASACAIRRQ